MQRHTANDVHAVEVPSVDEQPEVVAELFVEEIDDQRADPTDDQELIEVLDEPSVRRRNSLRRYLILSDSAAVLGVGGVAAAKGYWAELVVIATWWLWMTVRLDRERRISEFLDLSHLRKRLGVWVGISAVVGVFVVGSLQSARFAILAILMLFAMACLSRAACRFAWVQRLLSFQLRESLLLVGERDEVARTLREWVRVDTIEVIGVCIPETDDGPRVVEGHPVLGSARDIVSICQRYPVDAVALHDVGDLGGRRLARLQWALEQSKTFISLITPIANTAVRRVHARAAGRRLIVDVAPTTPSGVVVFIRSSLDRVAATILLVLGSPILLASAVAIKVTSRGPVMFRQVRVRENNRTFLIYKLRTMTSNAEAAQEELAERHGVEHGIFKVPADPRVTRVGRILRGLSIDELPQLLNVMKGEMALVGPRPAQPHEVARYNEMERRRLAMKPGLTGLWQVSGRSHLSWEESVRLDMDYVDNWSPGLDASIALETVRAVLKREGAY